MQTIPMHFVGYQNYGPIEKRLENIFDKAFILEYPQFILGVNEAVCNAARYSNAGPDKARISIVVTITNVDIEVVVSCETRAFEAKRYQQWLLELGKSKEYRDKDWGDYTADTDRSRGIWYMLTACDFVIYEADGSSVTLSSTIPYKGRPVNSTISTLVQRFMVSDRGVVG